MQSLLKYIDENDEIKMILFDTKYDTIEHDAPSGLIVINAGDESFILLKENFITLETLNNEE